MSIPSGPTSELGSGTGSHSGTPSHSPSPSPAATPLQARRAGLPRTPSGSSAVASRLTLSLLVILPDPEDIQRGQQALFGSPLSSSSKSPSRPTPLTSRQSTGRTQTVDGDNYKRDGGGHVIGGAGTRRLGGGVIDDIVDSGRRLSLAPGLGVGTGPVGGGGGGNRFRPSTSHLAPQQPSSLAPHRPLSSMTPTSSTTSSTTQPRGILQHRPHESPDTTTISREPVSASAHLTSTTTSSNNGPPAFGSSSAGRSPRSKRRPMTAAGPAPPIVPALASNSLLTGVGGNRGSMVNSSGLGILGVGRLGGAGRARPGWEGDEVVGMLRGSGQEVTVIRNAAQIPSILSPHSASPTFSTFNSQPLSTSRGTAPNTPITPVILVPLCDQPSLPSLSLLLQQGTTPTAVCFQQDLLDRARRAEEEWLPTALERVRAVVKMRDDAMRLAGTTSSSSTASLHPGLTETPVVIAYSANPGITPQTISACVSAGASGVLKPPFDLETARLIRRMVRAAKEGRVSSVVGLQSPGLLGLGGDLASPTYEEDDPFGRVILPPTALSMGGEHAGEIALSGALRNHSRSQYDSRSSSPLSQTHSTTGSIHANGRPSEPDTSAATGGPSRSRNPSIPLRKSSLGDSRGPNLTSTRPNSLENNKPTMTTSVSSKSLVTPTQPNHPYLFPKSTELPPKFRPVYDTRRRSVDVAGLGRALRHAQTILEHQQRQQQQKKGGKARRSIKSGPGSRFSPILPIPTLSPLPRITTTNLSREEEGPLGERRTSSAGMGPSHMNLPQGRERDPAQGSSQSISAELSSFDPPRTKETELAELLSSMYLQTQMATGVQIRGDEYAQLAAPLSPSHRARLVDSVSSWDFRPHTLSERDLFHVACILFEAILSIEGLIELDIQREQLTQFLFAVRAIYHAPNPYHNYIHAVDVLQATYAFLEATGLAPSFEYIRRWRPGMAPWRRGPLPTTYKEESGRPAPGSQRAREVLRSQDVLAILIAAMGHDIGHPGLSNAFMKNAQTPLSVVYDDKSVLENMHCVLIVQLLRKHGFGFLLDRHTSSPSNVVDLDRNIYRDAVDARGFKRVLYSSILATDMSLHFTWVQGVQDYQGQLNGSLRQQRLASAGFQDDTRGRKGVTEDEERIIFAQAIIKCADISNPTRPIEVSEYWSSVLLREWAVQASLEVDLDLPVSVIASADAALQAKGQIGFIDLFTQPLFDAVAELLPELQGFAERCSANRYIWSGRLEDAQSSDTIVIQPLLSDASQDDRFSTLFPMSLPTALVASHPPRLFTSPTSTTSLTPGNSSTESGRVPSPPRISPNLSLHGHGQGQGGIPSTPESVQSVFSDTTTTSSMADMVARTMRAVYHSNLHNYNFGSVTGEGRRQRLSSFPAAPTPLLRVASASGGGFDMWRGTTADDGMGGGMSSFNIGHYLENRRSSTPEVLPSQVTVDILL